MSYRYIAVVGCVLAHQGEINMFHELWGSHGRGEGCEPWQSARRGSHWGRGSWGGRSGPSNWVGDLFGPPPRADRGGVRYLVLDAIAAQARHGYEVIQSIEERSGGAYRPSPGVVYPTLQLLEELDHARVVEQQARKVYTITEAGQRDLEAHRDEVVDFYDRFADDAWERHIEDFGDLIRRAARLLKTFKRAARHGHMSSKAQAGIREVLDDAVKRIETILHDEAR
jgi:DNA-binding PadR family transcriptional regulator